MGKVSDKYINKEDIYMAYKHKKRYATRFFINKLQIKLDTVTPLLERPKSQNTHPELQECETESFIHAGGNEKCYSYLGRQFDSFSQS